MKLFEAIGRRLADSLSLLLNYRDLRKNEKFLDNVVEHIPNMIFVKDAKNLSFVRFNKAGEQLLSNLCVNAKDAIAGVGKVTIEIQNTDFDEVYCSEHKGLNIKILRVLFS